MSSKRRRHKKRKQRNRNNRHRQQTAKKVFEIASYICIRKQREGVGVVKKTGDKNSYLIAFKNGKYGWYRSTKINVITEQEYNDASSQFVIDNNLPSPSPTPSLYSASPAPINNENIDTIQNIQNMETKHQEIKFKQSTNENNMDNNTNDIINQTTEITESKMQITIEEVNKTDHEKKQTENENDQNKNEQSVLEMTNNTNKNIEMKESTATSSVDTDVKKEHIQNDKETDEIIIPSEFSEIKNNENIEMMDSEKNNAIENIDIDAKSEDIQNDTETDGAIMILEVKNNEIKQPDIKSTQNIDKETELTDAIIASSDIDKNEIKQSDIKSTQNIEKETNKNDKNEIKESEIKSMQDIECNEKETNDELKSKETQTDKNKKNTKKEKKIKNEKKKKPKISKFEKKMKLYYKVKDLRERSFLIMCDENKTIDLKSLYEYIQHFGNIKPSKNKVKQFLDFMKPNANNVVSFSKFVKAIDDDGDVMAAFDRFKKYGYARSKK